MDGAPLTPGEAAADAAAGVNAPATPGEEALTSVGDAPRSFKSTTFDEGGALEQAEAAPAKRRRGRPPRAQGRTVFDNTPITGDEMAFLRAVVQGVSPQRAAQQFLIDEALQNGRAARPYLRQLLDRLHDAAERIQTMDAAYHRDVLAELRALRREAADPAPRPKATPATGAPTVAAGPPPSAPEPAPVPAPAAAQAPRMPAAPSARAARARRPTLDEFAARFDADMYSEADLIALYQEEFPDGDESTVLDDETGAVDSPGGAAPPSVPPSAAVPSPPQADVDTATVPRVRHALPVHRRLTMLDDLAQRVAIAPAAESLLSVWLGERLATAMRTSQGLTRLAQLVSFINANGTTWHEKIPTLGPARAARLAVWLDRHASDIGVRVRGRILAVLAARAAADAAKAVAKAARAAPGQPVVPGPTPAVATALTAEPASAPALSFGLVPLDALDWPVDLLGADGEFRTTEVNAYRASNDREALQAWLAKAVATMALASQDVVRRAIERLVLWALVERGQPLSSLGTEDLIAFREFLYAPPAHWCGNDRVLRGSQDWRPLRGPMQAAGVRQIIVFVRQMYADWHTSGYLRVNPAHKLSHHRVQTPGQREEAQQQALAAAAAMTMNVRRSFVQQDLEAMARELASMEEIARRKALEAQQKNPEKADPEKDLRPIRRLRAILSLYLDSGLRRSEVDQLTFETPVPVRLDNGLSDWMQITVLGKGDKPRTVPLLRSTLDALEAHYTDRLALIAAGKLPKEYGEISRAKTPVLSILQPVRREPNQRGPGMTPADAPRAANEDGRLAGSSIAGMLKEFFKRVARNQHQHLVAGQADFAAASTHWLRHTFAHRLLYETDAKLPTVQKLLGHQSLATTGLYLDADMAERLRAVAQLKPVF